jgi:hypothetical protein
MTIFFEFLFNIIKKFLATSICCIVFSRDFKRLGSLAWSTLSNRSRSFSSSLNSSCLLRRSRACKKPNLRYSINFSSLSRNAASRGYPSGQFSTTSMSERPEPYEYYKELLYIQILTTDLLGSIIGWRGDLLPIRIPKDRPLPFGRRKRELGENKLDVPATQ